MGCCSSTQTDKPILSLEPEHFFYHEHTDDSDRTNVIHRKEPVYISDDDI